MIINPPLNVIFNIIHILNIFHAKIQEKKIAKGTIGFNNSTPQNPKIMCSWFCQLKQILNCLGPIHFLLFLLTATTIADTTYGSCNCHVLPMIEKNLKTTSFSPYLEPRIFLPPWTTSPQNLFSSSFQCHLFWNLFTARWNIIIIANKECSPSHPEGPPWIRKCYRNWNAVDDVRGKARLVNYW